MEISGVLLMFMLGLRHGLDPDHIAIIDGVSVRYTATHPKLAKWTGTLFAAGHGSVVTLIAVMISCFSHSWTFSKQVWSILDWGPGIVLIGVGLMNLRMLSREPNYRPKGFKTFFIPKKLKNSSNPLAIVAIGILFAMVFDTNTQAAAWAYTATGKLSIPSALLLGLSFSAGMILTDTLDSRILFLLMSKSTHSESVLNYRRKIGWIIVAASLVVGVYKIDSLVFPKAVLQENLLTLIGGCFFVFLALFYTVTVYIYTPKLKKQINGY